MPTMTDSRDANKFNVRMPEGMRDRIKAHADENRRSMNSEIVSLLEMALFEADMSRMQSGMKPLRPVTDKDQDIINHAKDSAQRREDEQSSQSRASGLTEAEKEDLWQWIVERGSRKDRFGD